MSQSKFTKKLSGKTILITGASSGIGKATAIACAKAGMRVALAARGIEALEATAKQINESITPQRVAGNTSEKKSGASGGGGGDRVIVIPCDVCDDSSVATLFEQTLEAFGRLDVMYANAGYGIYGSIEQTTDSQIRDMFETNFYGTVRCVKEALPIMKKQGSGHILICSSACSEISLPMYGYYAATKAAQDSLAGALRAELCETNIKVSSVHPIGTYTEFFNQVAVKAGMEDVGLNTPDTLMQQPEHVAKQILKCLVRPCPEVWPHLPTRIGVAMATAFPKLGAMALRKMFKRKASE